MESKVSKDWAGAETPEEVVNRIASERRLLLEILEIHDRTGVRDIEELKRRAKEELKNLGEEES